MMQSFCPKNLHRHQHLLHVACIRWRMGLMVALVFGFHVLMAQDEPELGESESDTTAQKLGEGKIKTPWRPQLKGMRIGVDISKLAISLLSDQQQTYEVKGEVLIDNQFFLTADFAQSSITRFNEQQTYQYKASGIYWRGGLEYNMLYTKTDDHAVTFGLAYAQADFSHELDYTLLNFYYGEFNDFLEEKGLGASWLETTFSLKYMILPNLFLASHARIKYRLSQSPTEKVEMAEAPGYGNIAKPNRVEVNYSLLYRIPFGSRKSKKQVIKVVDK